MIKLPLFYFLVNKMNWSFYAFHRKKNISRLCVYSTPLQFLNILLRKGIRGWDAILVMSPVCCMCSKLLDCKTLRKVTSKLIFWLLAAKALLKIWFLLKPTCNGSWFTSFSSSVHNPKAADLPPGKLPKPSFRQELSRCLLHWEALLVCTNCIDNASIKYHHLFSFRVNVTKGF